MTLDLIYVKPMNYGARRHRKREQIALLPIISTPNRAVLEPILADLDRLWEMRHWIPNPGEPILPKRAVV